jgi:hypothetical protein
VVVLLGCCCGLLLQCCLLLGLLLLLLQCRFLAVLLGKGLRIQPGLLLLLLQVCMGLLGEELCQLRLPLLLLLLLLLHLGCELLLPQLKTVSHRWV